MLLACFVFLVINLLEASVSLDPTMTTNEYIISHYLPLFVFFPMFSLCVDHKMANFTLPRKRERNVDPI